ncbi:hypothetical protein MSNKSG1_14457 [Marinobacter santoriniensis NKSG1]|uniref:Oxidoreductase molybdopterin-binding domain-containing protein n=1 Tax=Marinobacter santoriniensis NKSG1 TaxID=1288826 RepID=M7CMX2_9GAMM|nr:hypothetical protein MSNKSG1_14457 [Marinobacter santoriniensis NKSG1]
MSPFHILIAQRYKADLVLNFASPILCRGFFIQPYDRGDFFVLRLIFTAFLATFAMALQAAPKLTITTDADTVVLDRNQLEAFPQTTITTTSPYYEGTAEFSGPSLKRVLESAGLSGQSRITFQALNDYQVDADLDEVMGLDAIVATRMNGKPMSVRNRGPFWVMLPLSDRPELDSEEYHRFMVWQLNRIGLQ